MDDPRGRYTQRSVYTKGGMDDPRGRYTHRAEGAE